MKFHARPTVRRRCLRHRRRVEEGGRPLCSTTDGEVYQAKAVIYATAQHRHPAYRVKRSTTARASPTAVPATVPLPCKRPRRRRDTALTDALFLSKLTDQVTIVHRKDRFRAQDNLVKQAERNKNIERVMMHTVSEIKGDGNKVTAVVLNDLEKGVQYEREFDAVFVFVGMIPQTDILDASVLTADKYVKTNERMETLTDGLYAAGDVRDTVFRQLITAASDGAIAAHCASEYIDELEAVRTYR